MIVYANITPIMTLPTFIIGFIAVLTIGAAIAEISESMEEKRCKKLGAKERLTPSQLAVKRYYEEREGRGKQAEMTTKDYGRMSDWL